VSLFLELHDNFGNFVYLLASVYIGCKGFIATIVQVGQIPYYKDFLMIPAERYQSLKTVAGVPWAMKSMFGALSEAFPILGYHKRYYIIISAGLALVALFFLGTLPDTTPAGLSAALFFMTNLFVCFTDLLCEGKYAEKMRENTNTKSGLVSWVWGLTQVGVLAGSAVAGPISEMGYPRTLFWLCIPAVLQLLPLVFLGWLPEEQLPVGNRGYQGDKVKRRPQLFYLGITVACSALTLAAVGELCQPVVQFGVSLVVAVVVCFLGYLWLPPVLAKANLYMFICNAFYLQIDGATTYFYIAKPEQYVNSPHFSNVYYFTYTSLVGAVAGLLGVWLFNTVLSKGNFRTAFWVTTLIQCLSGVFDIVLVKRWNIALGVPDKLAYMLGDAMIFNVVLMFSYMPAIILTAKACPDQYETVMYALLAGYQNLGSTVGSFAGAWLIDISGINTNPKELPWNFDALPLLLFLCHMVLPMLSIPFTWILIPDLKMTDTLKLEDEEDPKKAIN